MTTSLLAGQGPKASQLSITQSRYISTDTTTTIATGFTEIIVSFATAAQTYSNLTASGTNNNTFTINQTGIWAIDMGVRCTFSTSPTSGDIFGYIYLIGGKYQLSGSTTSAPISNCSVRCSATVWLNAGDQVRAGVINSTNQIATLGAINEIAHISFMFLQGV